MNHAENENRFFHSGASNYGILPATREPGFIIIYSKQLQQKEFDFRNSFMMRSIQMWNKTKNPIAKLFKIK